MTNPIIWPHLITGGARTHARRIDTHVDTRAYPRRRQEWRRGTEESVRHKCQLIRI